MGSKLKILILSQWFAPEPDLKGLPFAKELVKKGHQVQVLTGFPNYPGGKVYPGYKVKLYQKEFIEGIIVIRTWLYPSHDNSSIKRIINYFSFALSATIFGIFFIKKFDVMYVYHPPATVSIPALILSFVKKIPIVYDIQDLWPDTLKSTGMINNSFVLSVIDIYMKFVYKRSGHITVLSEGFKAKLIERGVESNKVSVIHNWSLNINSEIPEKENILDQYKTNRKKVILFAGTMGKAQGLDIILSAAKEVEESWVFLFIGGGIEVNNLKTRAEVEDIKNVFFLPRVDKNEVTKYLHAADVLLVNLKNDPLFTITIPSKIQAYMLAGKPILCGVRGDASEMIKAAECGLRFEPENRSDFISKLKEFYKMPDSELITLGCNGKKFYHNNLSLEKGSEKFLSIFENVKILI